MSRYFIQNEKGVDVGLDILMMYYGSLWESALDRLNHQADGHLMTLYHHGCAYRIYRRLQMAM